MKYSKVIDLILSHPKKFLFFFVLIQICIFTGFKGFKLHITIDKLINPNSFESKRYFELKDEFKLGPNLIILNKHKSGLNEVALCQYRSWLSGLALDQDYIYSSFSPFNMRKSVYSQTPRINKLHFNKIYNLNCEVPSTKINPFSPIHPTPWNKIIFNTENKDFMVDIKLATDGEENFESKIVPKVVANIKSSFDQKFDQKLNKVDTYWVGSAVYQYWMKVGLKYNNLLNLGIIVIIIIFFKIFLGTFISSIYFFITLIYSISMLYGLMSLFSVPIDILNNTIILLLTISSLGDFLFLSNYQVKTPGRVKESFKAMALPSFFTSLTTFIGFISLYSSELEIIQRLGLWSSISAVIEWFSMFLVLPLIITIFGRNRTWVKPNSYAIVFLQKIERINLSKFVAYSLLIFFLITPYSFTRINLKDNPMFLFPKDQDFSKSMQYLEETRGFQGDVSIVFKNHDNKSFNMNIMEKLKDSTIVAHIESPYEMVNYFTQDLPPLTKRTVVNSIKHSTGYKRLVSENQSRAILYLKKTDLFAIDNLKNIIKRDYCPSDECYLSGKLVSYAAFANEVPKTLMHSLLWSLGLVGLIIGSLCLYLKEKQYLVIFLSSFWGVAFIISYIAFSGVSINFVTCAALSILVGLTGDNAIQYLLSVRSLNSGIEQKSTASILTSMIMISCSTLFLFYYFQPPRDFGIILIIGLFSSLVGDLWILKAIKKSKKKPQYDLYPIIGTQK